MLSLLHSKSLNHRHSKALFFPNIADCCLSCTTNTTAPPPSSITSTIIPPCCKFRLQPSLLGFSHVAISKTLSSSTTPLQCCHFSSLPHCQHHAAPLLLRTLYQHHQSETSPYYFIENTNANASASSDEMIVAAHTIASAMSHHRPTLAMLFGPPVTCIGGPLIIPESAAAATFTASGIWIPTSTGVFHPFTAASISTSKLDTTYAAAANPALPRNRIAISTESSRPPSPPCTSLSPSSPCSTWVPRIGLK